MKSNTLVVLSTALLIPTMLNAQERAASGATETQMTWSALKLLTDQAKDRADGAHTRLDTMVACSRAGKLYAPGAPGADGGGCIALPAAGITGINHGNTHYVGPGHNGGPVLDRWSGAAQNLVCPAGTVMVGLIVRTSGTCENRCNQDGPIIQSLVARCAALQ